MLQCFIFILYAVLFATSLYKKSINCFNKLLLKAALPWEVRLMFEIVIKLQLSLTEYLL